MGKERSICGLQTEVYSRVCGYFRPVALWNKGKKAEFEERATFNLGKAAEPQKDGKHE